MQDVVVLRMCWVWRQVLDSRKAGGWAAGTRLSISTATEIKLNI